MQAVMIGFTNTGKSSLLTLLTNAKPKISENKFTTLKPIVGMMAFAGTSIQIIENPSIKSNSYDKGLANTADTILLIIDELEQIPKIKKHLEKSKAKKIIVFNDKENLSEHKKRKIKATLKSKK